MNRGSLGCALEIVETLVLTVVIFFLIQNFVAQPYRVEQESMLDTLQQNDYVLVDKLTPRFDPYKRGDVVVFHPPRTVAVEGGCASTRDEDGAQGGGASEPPFIKRVIGVPGDTVEVRGGAVFVNGQQLEEPYVRDGTTEGAVTDERVTVPDGCVFVMGDNRQHSRDSREFGPVMTSEVVGRAWLRYWPLSALGILDTPRYAVGAAPSASPRPGSPSPGRRSPGSLAPTSPLP